MQFVTGFLNWLGATPLSFFVRESSWAFAAAESVHVIAIALVIGLIAVVDLRLLGLASTKHRVTDLTHQILPWTWGAFVVAVIAGSLMLVSAPLDYFNNTALRIKFLLMLLAGINMLFFHFVTFRDVAQWDRNASVPLAGKIAGAASLTFWIAIVFFGRQIGFTMY